MKPYTGSAECPKCATKWSAYKADPKYCNQLECKTFAAVHHPVPEHLHLTCQNCGYEWLMKCADAKSTVEENKLNPAPTAIEVYCPNCNALLSYWLHGQELDLRSMFLLTEQQTVKVQNF